MAPRQKLIRDTIELNYNENEIFYEYVWELPNDTITFPTYP